MKHKIALHKQKIAVAKAIDILEEIYPARISQKKVKGGEDGSKAHIEWMEAVLETIDGLCERKDMRESLNTPEAE